MKKTVKINISGIMFHLDEDAYEMLQNYLAAINQRFASTSEGKEIISDIEYRIAEILQSKLSESKQVITLEDINEIIAIMGKPEDFD
ncbi:MAG TPA: PspC family transcriptional regulator, partial [Bacteroidales bacterium]|nr:PspC family transcriptional regulator [Bacteroidales bacterium]